MLQANFANFIVTCKVFLRTLLTCEIVKQKTYHKKVCGSVKIADYFRLGLTQRK